MGPQSSSPTREDRSKKADKGSPGKFSKRKGPQTGPSAFSVRPKTQLTTAEELKAIR